MSADRIKDSRAAYWDSVATRLRRAGSSPLQAQVVWLKEANATPVGGFPASPETLQWNLASVVRIIKQRLPNVRLCYITSRIYAGYATTNLNPEPYAYEAVFAVKWLIDSQIRGDSLNFDPAHGLVEAPWLGASLGRARRIRAARPPRHLLDPALLPRIACLTPIGAPP